MSIPARLSIVTLGTRDQGAMKSFYEGLGLSASVEMSSFACFVLGGVGLALYPLEDLAEEAVAGDAPEVGTWRGVTLALNVDTSEEVDAVWEAWVAAGADPVSEPEDRSWGGRSGYVADPEGNRWEIAWAPGVTFDERGAVVAFGGP